MNKNNQKPPVQSKPDEGEILKKQMEELKTKYLRALADYQNLEKRVREEREEVIKNANKHLILKLLPFLDHLDKAEMFVKDPGLKLIKDSFYKLLEELGVKEIVVAGREFDPQVAEAIELVPGDKDNIMVEVLRKGYELFGMPLRPAQVKVSKREIKNSESKIEN